MTDEHVREMRKILANMRYDFMANKLPKAELESLSREIPVLSKFVTDAAAALRKRNIENRILSPADKYLQAIFGATKA